MKVLKQENCMIKLWKLILQILVGCAKNTQKIRGDNQSKSSTPFIETLYGKYSGENVLEGFCANTDILCNEKDDNQTENTFYKMCYEDNMVIFDITSNEEIRIPPMKIENLKEILFSRLKLGRACDFYKLTVEHLRFS